MPGEKDAGNVQLDVTAVDLGHSLHVRDLVMDEDIRVLTDPNRTVVSVLPPKLREEGEVAAEELEAEEGAEPEVVGKEGKEEEEAEETEEKKR